MDLALTAGMNETNRDERDGRQTPPPKRAATVAPVVTPGNPAQPRANPSGGLFLQGDGEGCPQVRGGHESTPCRSSWPTLRWMPGRARLARLPRLQAIRGSVAARSSHQAIEAESTSLSQPAFRASGGT